MIYANKDDVEFDMYSTSDINEIFDYRSNFDMREYEVDSYFHCYFVFNIDKNGELDEVLNDVRFREAISYAIDRESIFNDVYFGIGNIIDSPIPPSSEAYVERGISYNPEKAKDLLDEMNYDFDRPIKIFYYHADKTIKKFIDAVKDNFEHIGLTVEITEPNNISLLVFDDYDICLKGLSVFDYHQWYLEYQSLSSINTYLIGGDTSFDDLISELSATLEYEEQIPMLQKLQQLEFEKTYKIPLFSLSERVYINRNRLSLPENLKFGNLNYKYDWHFDNWEILD